MGWSRPCALVLGQPDHRGRLPTLGQPRLVKGNCSDDPSAPYLAAAAVSRGRCAWRRPNWPTGTYWASCASAGAAIIVQPAPVDEPPGALDSNCSMCRPPPDPARLPPGIGRAGRREYVAMRVAGADAYVAERCAVCTGRRCNVAVKATSQGGNRGVFALAATGATMPWCAAWAATGRNRPPAETSQPASQALSNQ